jgi:uncharacterized protein YuzE
MYMCYDKLLQAYIEKEDKEKAEQKELLELRKKAKIYGIEVWEPMIYRYKSMGVTFKELKRDIEKEIEFQKKKGEMTCK